MRFLHGVVVLLGVERVGAICSISCIASFSSAGFTSPVAALDLVERT